MTLLYRMILFAFIPVFILALFFFILILELVDLFANLWRYLNFDVPLVSIFKVLLLYLPKCISFSVPIALLFAVSFTLGNFYANNELISIFGAGVSLFRFVLPVLFVSLLLSGLWFLFEEHVVIDTLEKKNELSNNLLKQQSSLSNTNVTVMSPDNSVVYHAEYYNDETKTLSNVMVIQRGEDMTFQRRIESDRAEWKEEKWVFKNSRLFSWNEEGTFVTEKYISEYTLPVFNQRPASFRKTVRNVEEMARVEAKEWVESLRKSGLPFRGALTEYYKRFSFALTPFVVAMISGAIGGRLKKNILLMSLLLSLVISVVYYVMQMVLILFAKLGYIPPLAGAWGTFLIFLCTGFWLFKNART